MGPADKVSHENLRQDYREHMSNLHRNERSNSHTPVRASQQQRDASDNQRNSLRKKTRSPA